MIDESGRRRHYDGRRRSRDSENQPQWVLSNGRAVVDRPRRVRNSDRARNLVPLHGPRRDEDSFNRRARNVERSLQAALDSEYPRVSGEFSGDAHRERSTTRSYFMPSPPYSNNGNMSGASGGAPSRSLSATPANASAHLYPELQNNLTTDLDQHSSNDTIAFGPSLVEFLPPLTRVQGRIPSPADSNSSRREYFQHTPAMTYDQGRRSPAMSDSSSARDTWETLLTTMEPDEHLPSASSSFTSAEASANAARSTSSVRSSRTTAPTRLGPFSAHSSDGRSYTLQTPCDLDESDLDSLPDLIPLDEYAAIDAALYRHAWAVSSGTTSESNTEASSDSPPDDHNDLNLLERAIHREFGLAQRNSENGNIPAPSHGGRVYPPPRRLHRTLMRTDGFHPGIRRSGLNGTRRSSNSESRARSGPRSAQRLERRLAESDQENIQRLRRGHQAHYLTNQSRDSDVDLRTMQEMIQRLARREDIPNEWWAAVGLERSVRESQVGSQRDTRTRASGTETAT